MFRNQTRTEDLASAYAKIFSSGSTSRWHQDQDKLHLVVAGRQVQDDGEQPRCVAVAPAADDEVLVLGLLLQPAAQRGEALLVEREVPPGALVEVVHAAVLPGRVVEDGAPRRHVQGFLDRWRLLKLGFRFLQTIITTLSHFKILRFSRTRLNQKRNDKKFTSFNSSGTKEVSILLTPRN